MECYDFELNISAYIDGELKQDVINDFIKHKDSCNNCLEKLISITNLIKAMPQLSSINTSNDFISNLNKKINEIDNQRPKLFKRIFDLWKFEPIPSLGMGLAAILVVISGYLLINQDSVPQIKNENLFKKQQFTDQNQNSLVNPVQNNRALADLDSASKINNDNFEEDDKHKIHLMGGNK